MSIFDQHLNRSPAENSEKGDTPNLLVTLDTSQSPEMAGWAAEAEADGVHLGQDDMPLTEARKQFPELNIFGLSTHNPDQAQRAAEVAPDYCGVGPVYATPTKEIPDPALGPDLAGRMIQSAPFTTVAIGGINETNIPDVRRAGAINFCVVRPVCLSPAPFDAIRRLHDAWFTV